MDAADILKNNGIKKSAQRIAVITALQRRRIPLTEQDIKEEMGELYDRITFYRTMQVLVNVGIVHRIVVDRTTTEYAMNESGKGHSHVHFYCKRCHAVTCLKEVPVNEYHLPEGYTQEDCDVIIKGICPDCR